MTWDQGSQSLPTKPAGGLKIQTCPKMQWAARRTAVKGIPVQIIKVIHKWNPRGQPVGGVSFAVGTDSFPGFYIIFPRQVKAETWRWLVLPRWEERRDHGTKAFLSCIHITTQLWEMDISFICCRGNSLQAPDCLWVWIIFILCCILSPQQDKEASCQIWIRCLDDRINLKFLRIKLILLLTPDNLFLPKKTKLKDLYKAFKVLWILCKPDSILPSWVFRHSRALRIKFSMN